jgi:hypothetical protein
MSPELRHPEGELLLPYLDGELSARKARQVRRHVQACWQCRAELEELQNTVGDCVRYRARLRETPLSDPPRPWAGLSSEFDRIDAAEQYGSLFRRPMAKCIVWSLGSAAVVAATLTLHPWNRPTSNLGARPQAQLITPAPAITPPPARPTSAPAAPTHLPAEVPQREPAPVATGLANELLAVAALHKLGADLGDPVEVAREGQRVVVRGTGVSPARQQEIRQALVSLPNIDLQFPQPAPHAAPSSAEPQATAQAPAPPSPMQNRLEAQLGGHNQFENFSSQLLDHQEAAMARIYALRRLAAQFPSDADGQLSADNQHLLRDLARQHLEAMARELTAIRRIAVPVLGPVPNAVSGSLAMATWQAAAEDVFSSGQQVDSLLAGLLGLAASDDAQPRSFLTALAQLQQSMQQCERLLMR